MFRTLIIAAALAAPIAAHAAQPTGSSFAIDGAGVGVTCGQYVSENLQGYVHMAHQAWAFGFLSGMVMGMGHNALAAPDPKAVDAMLNAECLYTRQQFLSDAVQKVFFELDKDRS